MPISLNANKKKRIQMRNILTFILALSVFVHSHAQDQWFSTYGDSIALVTDANEIIQQMADRIQKINPAIDLHQNKAIKNTTPYLIYIDSLTVNLPFWPEVIPSQQNFFSEVAGSEKEGEEVFGLFFNGFYLAHEMGHSFAAKSLKKFDNAYDSEYDANTIAILYWRADGHTKELKMCYDYARKMLNNLKNPVPKNRNYKKYMTQNYQQLASDPYKYGFIQFSQFVEIYEDTKLPDFETYINDYQKK